MMANRMNKSTLLLLVMLLPAAFCHAAEDAEAIIRATTDYVKKETAINDPLVTVQKVTNGYARVQVKSKSGITDPAIALLKLEKGKWRVLELGTAFGAEDLKELKIPASLQQ
jgi:hypothetical protein